MSAMVLSHFDNASVDWPSFNQLRTDIAHLKLVISNGDTTDTCEVSFISACPLLHSI
jgi:hypothetical protein